MTVRYHKHGCSFGHCLSFCISIEHAGSSNPVSHWWLLTLTACMFQFKHTISFCKGPICVWTLAPDNTERSSVWSVVFKIPGFWVMSTAMGMFIVNEWVVRWPAWVKQTSDHGWIFSTLSSEVLTCKIII